MTEVDEWMTEVNEWMNAEQMSKWKNKWVTYYVLETMQFKLKLMEMLMQVQFPKKHPLRQRSKFIRNAFEIKACGE